MTKARSKTSGKKKKLKPGKVVKPKKAVLKTAKKKSTTVSGKKSKPLSRTKPAKKSKPKAKAKTAIKSKLLRKKNASPKKTVKKRITARTTVVTIQPAAEKKVRKFKPNKKTRYSLTELRHFREIILQERKAIFESAKANMDALVDKESGEYKGDNLTYSSHMAEQGTDEMEREKNYLFVQRDEKYLGYLQDALMRIDQGTYGICVDCRDEPKNLCRTCPLIAKERLELVPITQHCIECKNLRG